MPFHVTANQTVVEASLGESVGITLRVENLSAEMEQVQLSVAGLDATWVRVQPDTRNLPGLTDAEMRITLTPPTDPTRALAGHYPFRLRVASTLAPTVPPIEVVGDLRVRRSGDYRLRVEPGRAQGIREATYTVHVTNTANAPLDVGLVGRDGGGAVQYEFSPPRLTVPAAGTAQALLRVVAASMVTRAQTMTLTIAAAGDWAEGAERNAVLGQSTTILFSQDPAPTLWLEILPPADQANLTTPQAPVTYGVRVGNPGPMPVRVALAAQGGGVMIQVEPREVTLAPQSDTRAALLIRPAESPGPAQRSYPFSVAARAVDGWVQPAAASGQAVQSAAERVERPPRPFPWWLVLLAGGIMLVLLALLVYLLR